MEHVVYMPIHAMLSDQDLKVTLERTIDAYNSLAKYLKTNKIPPAHPRT